MGKSISSWTIYHNPKDFPGLFVARRFELDKPTDDHFTHTDVECVRQWVHAEAVNSGQGSPYCLPRQPQDDPVIIETWI